MKPITTESKREREISSYAISSSEVNFFYLLQFQIHHFHKTDSIMIGFITYSCIHELIYTNYASSYSLLFSHL